MSIPVLLDDGHVRLTTGKVIAMPPEYFGFVASETSFTVTAPAAFGKIRVSTCRPDSGNVLWSVTRDQDCGISVEDRGVVLRLPGGVANFPLPVRNVIQAGRTVAVCLSTKPVRGRVPTEEDERNPIIAVNFFGHELWRLDGYFASVSIGDSPTQVIAADKFTAKGHAANTGSVLFSRWSL